MKKKLVIIFAVLIALLIIAYLFVPYVAVNMITDYEPYTFEKVLTDPELCEKYGISTNTKPEDYGFESKEIDFKSLDGTMLNSWYIPAKKTSNHCLLLIHGRTSNRLKTMKYLALIDSLQLDTLYNIFIPDLRNSGKSQATKTYMGYKFGEDVVASILMLNSKYEQDTFCLYGFSMGAMATLVATGRKDLTNLYKDKNIVIENIILDSPLVNVKESVRDGSPKSPLFSIIFDDIFELYSDRINGYAEYMKISTLLDPEIPTLILQSEDDETTLIDILQSELNNMKDFDKLKTVYFQGPDHVRMFQDDRTKSKYINSVRTFLVK